MYQSSRYSSTQYQTTNYGLAGLCETHMDPAGFVRSNAKIHIEQMHLRTEGKEGFELP